MFCSGCGQTLEQGARFCLSCGTPAGGAAAPQKSAFIANAMKGKVSSTFFLTMTNGITMLILTIMAISSLIGNIMDINTINKSFRAFRISVPGASTFGMIMSILFIVMLVAVLAGTVLFVLAYVGNSNLVGVCGMLVGALATGTVILASFIYPIVNQMYSGDGRIINMPASMYTLLFCGILTFMLAFAAKYEKKIKA
jgi:hypothetical protein